MFLTYQYQIKPNKNQKEQLKSILNQDRTLYNAALQERIDAYQKNKISINLNNQSKSLTEIRKDGFEGHRYRQQSVLERLDKTFKSFFRRIKRGEKAGFPRFKNSKRWNSIEINQQYKIKDGRFYNNDFKEGIKINFHRELPEIHRHCGATLVRNVKGWYLNLKIEIPNQEEKTVVDSAVGIDMGLNHFLITSDGEFVDNPRYYRKSLKKLKKAQRLVSRAKRGSNNRKKKVKLLAKQHLKVANQRKDFQHQLSKQLVSENDMIIVEDLRIKNMVRNHNLALSISDAGWGMFIDKIAYKAEEAGKHFVKVNPQYTSQKCYNCGEIVKKSLSQRTHKCKCGFETDRDINAALNIRRDGIALLSLNEEVSSFDKEISNTI